MSKVPFFFTPARWLLKGDDLRRAEIIYRYGPDYDGTDMHRELLDYDYVPGSQDHQLQALNLDHADGKIDDHSYELLRAEVLLEGQELEVALIEIERQHGVISDREAAKRTATAKKEAWVDGPMTYDGHGGVLFDLDWNHYWIEELKQNGYTGETDDIIMKKWFAALCYSEVIEQHGGAEMDPFLYETARAALNKIIGRDN